jgi:hypothetical protein
MTITPYLDWIDHSGFRVREYWDFALGRMQAEGKLQLMDFQRNILGLALQPQADGTFPYNRLLYSTIKKSGKTAIAGSIGAWAAECFPPGTEIYCIANDQESSKGRVFSDIEFHAQGIDGIYITQYRITYPNGTFVQALSQSYKSAAGSRHAVTLWDELHAYSCIMSTRILTADLRWVEAGSIQVGDKLTAFDEYKGPQAYRAYKTGTVTAVRHIQAPALKVSLTSGHALTVTRPHQFLARRGARNEVVWVEAKDLQPGDRLMKVLPVWSEDMSKDAGYLAGILDGEGWLGVNNGSLGYHLTFAQRDNEVLRGSLEIAEQLGLRTLIGQTKGGTNEDVINVNFGNKAEVMKALGTLRPRRLLPKFSPDNLGRMTAQDWDEVVEVEEAGTVEIAAITVDAKTYLSDGYASHNTTEPSRRMWAEMTPIPTIPHSLQVVVTYAGYENESDLLWDLYLRGVGTEEHPDGRGVPHLAFPDLPVYTNQRILTYWDHEPRMPWQTDEWYANEQEIMRPADYLRLHENRWVTSHEAFIDPVWWDDCTKVLPQSAELWAEHPYRFWPVYVGVDVAPKRDCSAVVGVTYDAKLGKVALVFHRIWTPVEAAGLDLEATVEAYLLKQHRLFKLRSVVYDPYQFHRSMTTLRNKGLTLDEFQQSAGNMTAASTTLYDLLRQKNLLAYPDSQARDHIKNAVAKDTGRGFRIVKDTTMSGRKRLTRKPVDFAVALAMASHTAIESGGLDVGRPVVLASPFADQTAWKTPPLSEQERQMPLALRSDS